MSEFDSAYPKKVVLPAFGEIAREFSAVFNHRVRTETRRTGIHAEISAHFIHEGSSSSITRSNESSEEVKMHSASAEIELPANEIERFGEDEPLKAIKKMSEQFARQQSVMMFSVIDEATKKTGNVVDGKGEPMSHDLFFQTLDAVQHDFEDGIESSKMTLVISPQMEDGVRKLDEEFKSSAELQERHQKLMIKKYEEFRDREVDRTLAG